MPSYFSHDSNARNNEKLLRLRMRHKAAGYGVYFMLLEILRGKPDFRCLKDYNVIAFELREDAALVKSVIEDFGLFTFSDDGKYFYSEGFRRRMEKAGYVSQVRRDAAKRRWNNSQCNNNQQHNNNETIQSRSTDKRRPSDVATSISKAATGKF